MTDYTYTEPVFEAVPAELRALPRWVTWRAEGATGEKPRKIPYAPDRPNTRASSTDPDTWGTFEQAEASYYDGERTGIGFVLNNDGIVGVDIDNCISGGEVSPDALQMLDWLGATYVEVSPSGTGLRAFGYAPPLERGVKGKLGGLDVELYSTGRYLTLTGKTIKPGKPFVKLDHFETLAHELRGAGRDVVDPETGEIEIAKPHDRHAELIRRVLTGDVFHDSLRDLAASFVANGMNAGAAVSQLRALMQASGAQHDDRWKSRYNQIPALVRSAQEKFKPEPAPDPIAENITSAEIIKLLDVVWANELPTEYTPPDELVQGVITCGSSSVVYGDSNSGKTFFVLDMCCAIARGVEWMGRKTEPGLVVYLATEAPASIMARVQAYQKYHGCIVENLAIVRMPVNFYTSGSDAANVIKMIQHVEQERGLKARIIVGDTLARISAGANENSGEDMGPVMERFDRVSKATGAHMLVIHHNGKDSAKGARGWSGIRAHIDTEIEIEEKDGVRVAKMTKQRELASKNQEIRFKLEIVVMGQTKWGEDATTCVVLQDDSESHGLEIIEEPKKLIEARKFFEDAVMARGRRNNGVPFVSMDSWNDWTRELTWASDDSRRQKIARTKKTLLESGYISEAKGGYEVTDHPAWVGSFIGLGA